MSFSSFSVLHALEITFRRADGKRPSWPPRLLRLQAGHLPELRAPEQIPLQALAHYQQHHRHHRYRKARRQQARVQTRCVQAQVVLRQERVRIQLLAPRLAIRRRHSRHWYQKVRRPLVQARTQKVQARVLLRPVQAQTRQAQELVLLQLVRIRLESQVRQRALAPELLPPA